jgi:UDP-GlcNAc:undecaprenyl-phosphate GlcNAc-1-phosphate transferase
MFIAFIASFLLLGETWQPYVGLLSAMTIIMVMGIADDIRALPASTRLLIQVIATFLIVSMDGVRLTNLGDLFGLGNTALDSWSVAFTMFCLVGTINALNMIDGIDGLAGGVSLFAALWLTLFALLSGQQGAEIRLDITFIALVAIVIAGFLCFNLRHPWCNRASVFMGNSGSMMLGLVLGRFLVDFSQGEQPVFQPMIALWIFALPLCDTVRLMVKRILNGRSPFQGDRQHLHHLLLASGYSDAQTTVILSGISALLGGVGLAGWYWQVPDYLLVYAFMVMFLLYFLIVNKAWSRINQANKLNDDFTVKPEIAEIELN